MAHETAQPKMSGSRYPHVEEMVVSFFQNRVSTAVPYNYELALGVVQG